ncbi:Dps family protein [Bacteroides reticulotermitis]|uniref:Non-specific DNA-binding protein n=2 Tax=Bacteroides reticulotermitis TaxID=1133319 RepID=W4UW26_9BACE|nr:DNA starvation/stationary phase protection protein [Bacteroides reticulotermitis]MBB4044731.1 starvation-inducible DNA-binding protein [Bacteroides reticulotermitis]GAE84719.1 non-specific DNA-binding protein [Bacteroides reticulotermitis JCM 10512]
MKTLSLIHLNESGANNVVVSLQQLLADFQVYYTNLRGFHWNIKGSDFFVLHSQFETMYDDVAEKIDEIAERILMLGGTPSNKFSDYLKVSHINEVDQVTNGGKALENVLQTLSTLIGEERKILAIASQAEDEGTVALMSDYLKEQEKSVWMLTAYSSK